MKGVVWMGLWGNSKRKDSKFSLFYVLLCILYLWEISICDKSKFWAYQGFGIVRTSLHHFVCSLIVRENFHHLAHENRSNVELHKSLVLFFVCLYMFFSLILSVLAIFLEIIQKCIFHNQSCMEMPFKSIFLQQIGNGASNFTNQLQKLAFLNSNLLVVSQLMLVVLN